MWIRSLRVVPLKGWGSWGIYAHAPASGWLRAAPGMYGVSCGKISRCRQVEAWRCALRGQGGGPERGNHSICYTQQMCKGRSASSLDWSLERTGQGSTPNLQPCPSPEPLIQCLPEAGSQILGTAAWSGLHTWLRLCGPELEPKCGTSRSSQFSQTQSTLCPLNNTHWTPTKYVGLHRAGL